MGSRGPALTTGTDGRSKVSIINRLTQLGFGACATRMPVTFVLVRAASPHVIDYSEVGGRDGVGAATAVTVAAAQAAP